jgi:hypothetical protein
VSPSQAAKRQRDRLRLLQVAHEDRHHRGEVAALLLHVAAEVALQAAIQAEELAVEDLGEGIADRQHALPGGLHELDLARRHVGPTDRKSRTSAFRLEKGVPCTGGVRHAPAVHH